LKLKTRSRSRRGIPVEAGGHGVPYLQPARKFAVRQREIGQKSRDGRGPLNLAGLSLEALLQLSFGADATWTLGSEGGATDHALRYQCAGAPAHRGPKHQCEKELHHQNTHDLDADAGN
jgi:hypothetical protein